MLADNFGVALSGISAMKGNLDSLQLLLSRGKVDINAVGQTGNTLLCWAAMSGKLDVVKYLLTQGADTTLRNKNGMSALDLAYAGGHFDLATALRNAT